MKSTALDFDTLFSAGLLSAHAVSQEEGFRQRDLKFFIELFANWIETSFSLTSLAIQNTQVSRYLVRCEKEGIVARKKKRALPLYVLTRNGVVELLRRCVLTDHSSNPNHIFFIVTFIRGYKGRILDLLNSNMQFSKALEDEMKELLDTKALLKRQISCLDRSIQRLQSRVDDGSNIALIVEEELGRGASESHIISRVQKEYPYELNNQRPLSELLSALPSELRYWELLRGSKLRSDQIFLPLLSVSLEVKKQLQRLMTFEP